MAQAVSSSKQRGTTSRPSRRGIQPPVLKTTRYELVSSFLIALLIGFILLTAWVTALWLANRRIKTEDSTPIELLQLGGVEDGAPDETLKVESPEDPTDDPSVEDVPDETQVEEVVENVVELSDKAAQQVPEQSELASENTGKVGSSVGTGRRPLGSGGGEGNIGQRWFIRFGDRGTIDEYARQLDFFGIELGLHVGDKIVILSNLSQNNSSSRVVTSGKELKNQWYFTWAGGGRKKADIQLLKQKLPGQYKANADRGIIFHFYPQETIQNLGRLEKRQSKQPVSQIARTYFGVRRRGDGYEFMVTKFVYK